MFGLFLILHLVLFEIYMFPYVLVPYCASWTVSRFLFCSHKVKVMILFLLYVLWSLVLFFDLGHDPSLCSMLSPIINTYDSLCRVPLSITIT